MRTIKIVISTIFQNGGDATRAIEIAKIIKASKPDNCNLKIIFISHGSKFEQQALDLDFEIYRTEPEMKEAKFQDDFKSKFGELIGDEALAVQVLKSEIKAYEEIKPDLLLYGFWPIASIAKRIANLQVKSIAFLPIPLKEEFLKESHTFPDELILSRLTKNVQKIIIKIIPSCIAKRNPALRHSTIRKAAEKIGWQGSHLINIFQMLKSDLYLINDIPQFYNTMLYGEDCVFTGAIFAKSEDEIIRDEHINSILSASNGRKKIFCSLGSSGSKENLLEIIKVFNTKIGLNYSGIILSPPAICDIQEARSLLKNNHVYITDKFVPAKAINEKVDLVICHGGQGTLQTAITSGIPIVGVATQPEQKINLEHLEQYGVAVRVPIWKWKADNITQSVLRIFSDYKAYKMRAETLKIIYEKSQAEQIIANEIWGIIDVDKIEPKE